MRWGGRGCCQTNQTRLEGVKRVIIREYRPSDCKYLAELFYQTVHSINAKDYTDESGIIRAISEELVKIINTWKAVDKYVKININAEHW